MTDNTVQRTFNVQLNPDGVAAPTQQAATVCREIVDLYFKALSDTDLSKPPTPVADAFFRFGFKSLDVSASDRRSLHESWMLAKVFQELVRAIRASLEEAYFFTELAAVERMSVNSSTTFDEVLAPYRERAQEMNFPTLLAAVNLRLEKPLEFADAYRSMQAARNCFEHRNGIVGRRDAQRHNGVAFSSAENLHHPRGQRSRCLSEHARRRWRGNNIANRTPR
ncbi:hypothetical protein [Bradyrhizobium sp.]|jgi:hypothetical protein|uniref:hypothetical protein n=1 Tax=Bradyrhizobium sp. TaxID=376 RepID=UPI003C5C331D